MNVKSVEPKGDKGAAIMVMEDDTRVWTPEIDKAKPLVGKPIPADWTQRTGDFGPQALPPKQGKGNMPAAFRNTKEGQAFEQQQMNRRAALMQAVNIGSSGQAFGITKDGNPLDNPSLLIVADTLYAWLTSSSDALHSFPASDAGRAQNAGGASAPTSSGAVETKTEAHSQGDVLVPATPSVAPGSSEDANPHQEASPDRERVGGADNARVTGKNVSDSKPPACSHPSWHPSPTMPGWKVCDKCGTAKKGVAA